MDMMSNVCVAALLSVVSVLRLLLDSGVIHKAVPRRSCNIGMQLCLSNRDETTATQLRNSRLQRVSAPHALSTFKREEHLSIGVFFTVSLINHLINNIKFNIKLDCNLVLLTL